MELENLVLFLDVKNCDSLEKLVAVTRRKWDRRCAIKWERRCLEISIR